MLMNQFPFQRAEEALHAGVIPTIPSARHTSGHARGPQLLLVGRGRILTPAIRMVEQTWFRVPSLQRHLQSLLRQLPCEPCLLAHPTTARE